jgi:secreted trypsin-like serine protease
MPGGLNPDPAGGGSRWNRWNRLPSASKAVWVFAVALAVLAAAFPVSVSARGRAHTSIVGGGPVSISSFPSLAFVEARNASEFSFCTGAVVAPRVVLTAGHCVEDIETGTLRSPEEFAVATGVADLRGVGAANVFDVGQVVVYPGFEPGYLRGDAGLLILAQPTGAPPIRLATSGDATLLMPRTPIAIAGWGKTSGRSESISPTLQAAETVIQGSSYCQRAAGAFYPFFTSQVQFCAVDPPGYSTATCHGDSGGPAIARDGAGGLVEVGITSLGDPECNTYDPNVFTRVDRISTWVSRWIAAVEQGASVPDARVPSLRLPFMSLSRARALAARSLGEELGSRWKRAQGKRMGCERIEREKVKCGVSWWQGPNDYWGTITVYFLQEQGIVYWNDRYKIRFVNDYCWWRSGHRQTCVIRTFRR